MSLTDPLLGSVLLLAGVTLGTLAWERMTRDNWFFVLAVALGQLAVVLGMLVLLRAAGWLQAA